MVYWNAEWLPICLEHVNKNFGKINKFCNKLNYGSSELREKEDIQQKHVKCYNGGGANPIKHPGQTKKIQCVGGNNTIKISCKGTQKFHLVFYRKCKWYYHYFIV